MKNVFRKGLGLFTIALLLLLTACSGVANTGTNSGSSKGNTMYIGLVNAPVSFNPINSSDIAASWLEKFMFDTFLEMTGPLEFTPKLADSFETEDNQTFTIKLNEKAEWSDGTPVTANDVAFTMNLVANPKTETAIGTYLTIIDGLNESGKFPDGVTEIPSLTIVDDKTIQFKTKTPVDPNMVKEQLGSKFMILPEHVLKDVAPEDLQKDPFMQKPTVTNGPFKFVQYAKDQYVEYEKNDNYYLGEVQLDKMFVKIMPAANLVAQLQTGEIQMNAAGGIGKIAVQDFDTVKGFENVTTKTEKTYGYQNMMFNTEKITDEKVRQAFAYAIDREKIVNQLLKGEGEIVDGPYTSVSPYLDKDLATYTYDPEKAKQLLEEAGWDFDKTIDFVVPIGNKVREQSADIIAQNLEAIGIKLNTTTYDFPTIMSKAKAGEFDLLLMGFTNTIDPDVTTVYGSNATSNYTNYSNPEVDKLLLAGKQEPDTEKRKEIYNELQAIWSKELPVFTLYSDYDFGAISKDVAVGGPKVFGFHNELYKWAMTGAE
ncbi:ABC transporter substrate-binding protein [Niallia taxi]|uniref:Oligopeptide-binding protein AppA n=1 Tax=Niallia taxi TaxID=2499688 RepID=A0A437K6X3_9BACI|nr:ABC transporter substrate-binding protein [Niallia taxi]MCM3217413.1 ABC transporter substrate-binding protein [Niallia taxi]MED4055716.1 ABC transporter substrate-binding protein [Niallia taxi]MED4121378.1 ABC transporter substrate-binding protein [Niallia taxi]RVT59111.1 oligopeptide-binding protein AppA [Niallia taxi]